MPKDIIYENQTIPFGTCVFEHIGKKGIYQIPISIHEDEKTVTFKLDEKGIPFGHSKICPCTMKYDKSLIKSNSKISFAVSVLLENSDTNEVLLTRRPKYMRSFPLTWVVPGGGMDENEKFIHTLNREVKEEIGIDISKENSELIYSWESTYPQFIEDGPPRRQHFVRLKVKISSDFLKKNQIIPQKEEVDAYAWVSRENIKKCVADFKKDSDEEFDGMILEKNEFKPCKFKLDDLRVKNKQMIDQGSSSLSLAASNLFKVWLEKNE